MGINDSISQYMGLVKEMRALRKLLVFIRNFISKSVSSLLFAVHSALARLFYRIVRVESSFSRCFLISLFDTVAPEKSITPRIHDYSCQEMIRISPAQDAEEAEMSEFCDFVVIEAGEKSSSVTPVSSPVTSNVDENGNLICLISPPSCVNTLNESALSPLSYGSWTQGTDSPIEIINFV